MLVTMRWCTSRATGKRVKMVGGKSVKKHCPKGAVLHTKRISRKGSRRRGRR